MKQKSFDLYSLFPFDKDFNLQKELLELGFIRVDDPNKDHPRQYDGVLYDYWSDAEIPVSFQINEKIFPGIVPCNLNVYKGKNCIYDGLQPCSKVIFQILLAQLFPCKIFAQKIEEQIIEPHD